MIANFFSKLMTLSAILYLNASFFFEILDQYTRKRWNFYWSKWKLLMEIFLICKIIFDLFNKCAFSATFKTRDSFVSIQWRHLKKKLENKCEI